MGGAPRARHIFELIRSKLTLEALRGDDALARAEGAAMAAVVVVDHERHDRWGLAIDERAKAEFLALAARAWDASVEQRPAAGRAS